MVENECLVCFRELPLLYNKDRIANIHDDIEFKEDCLVVSCCLNEEHNICISCLKKLSLNFDSHMINKNNSLMFCPATEGCLTQAGTLNYFDHNLIKKILTEEEFNLYNDHAERFIFTGFEIVKCKSCYTPNVIPEKCFKDADIGRLIIKCSQSTNCDAIFCYTCKADVSYLANVCPYCDLKTENTNPSSFNKYFYKYIEDRLEGQVGEEKYFFRNKELTNEIILNQLSEIVSEPYVRCPICLFKVYKTEQCNGMDHCGVEFCYSCNRKTIGKLNDHWSELGSKGCWRFDNASLIVCDVPEFSCVDGVCYGHTKGDCRLEFHKEGIYKLQEYRTKGIVYHMLKSLLENKRNEIIEIINNNNDYNSIQNFLPNNFKYINYFDYKPISDILETTNRFEVLLENVQQQDTEDENQLNELQEHEQLMLTPENIHGNQLQTFDQISISPILLGYNQLPEETREMLERTERVRRYTRRREERLRNFSPYDIHPNTGIRRDIGITYADEYDELSEQEQIERRNLQRALQEYRFETGEIERRDILIDINNQNEENEQNEEDEEDSFRRGLEYIPLEIAREINEQFGLDILSSILPEDFSNLYPLLAIENAVQYTEVRNDEIETRTEEFSSDAENNV